MKKQTLGKTIGLLRREKGMTQLELAEKMGVTDKAVSKWERELSCPDISSIPRLAEILGVSVDELMQVKPGAGESAAGNKIESIVDLALKGVALAMGIAVTVLSVLEQLEVNSALLMLGLGLACLAASQLAGKGTE